MAEELFAPNSVWVSENTENFGPAYTAGLFFRKDFTPGKPTPFGGSIGPRSSATVGSEALSKGDKKAPQLLP